MAKESIRRKNCWLDLIVGTFTLLLPVLLSVSASAKHSENFFQKRLCAGMEQERWLSRAKARVDCVNDTHAIEVEFARKYKQAIGQALLYASEMDLKPGVILVCVKEDGNCLRYGLLAEKTLARWHINSTVWKCGPVSLALADCLRVEITGN